MFNYEALMTDFTEEDYEMEGTKPWKIKNDNDAEYLIEKVNEDLVEINRFEMALVNKIDVLKEKLEKVRNEKEYKLEKRNSFLIQYFEEIPEELKKKTKTLEKYRLPSGEIIKKYQGPEYKRDNDQLVKWIKENGLNDLIEIKESAKWADLKKQTKLVVTTLVFEDTVEVIEGVEVIERAPTLEFKEDL